jgi:hypothetical protein
MRSVQVCHQTSRRQHLHTIGLLDPHSSCKLPSASAGAATPTGINFVPLLLLLLLLFTTIMLLGISSLPT